MVWREVCIKCLNCSREFELEAGEAPCVCSDCGGNEKGISLQKICEPSENITIPGGVAKIYCGAFVECISLKKAAIPATVKSIGGYAFHCCKSLKKITIPESVKEIGENAFGGCEALESVTLP